MTYNQARKEYSNEIVVVLYYEKIVGTPLTETVLNRENCATNELLAYTCFETAEDGERTGNSFSFYV